MFAVPKEAVLIFSATEYTGANGGALDVASFLTITRGTQTMPVHEDLLHEFQEFGRTAVTAKAVMEHIARRLHENMARYNWVGFYLTDPAHADVLLIGPFVGSFTPNARIPLNTGLCGAAASTGQTVVVDDVAKDKRYLAGSSLVKAEIVVPIFAGNKLAAELDVESYFTNAFNKAEQEFVEGCAAVVEKYLGKSG